MIYMKQNGMLQKPMLVVVPKGLLSTWQRELTRWAPLVDNTESILQKVTKIMCHLDSFD